MPRKHRVFESFGGRLARLRKERSLTQVDLAQRLRIAQPNISDYERGESQPNADLIIKLAGILGVSSDELLGLKPTKAKSEPPRPRLLKRLAQIEKLPPHRQRALLTTIDGFLKGTSGS